MPFKYGLGVIGRIYIDHIRLPVGPPL